jgi:hypothetical protein
MGGSELDVLVVAARISTVQLWRKPSQKSDAILQNKAAETFVRAESARPSF